KVWEKARDSASDAIGARDWEAAFGKGIGKNLLEGATEFSRKPIDEE
ncbi:MAG: hypothetical protein GWO04_46570, partial [Actinobacteria bacterium]|nr:hypothetical protein [Actinomycetota bacterium]NIS36960.1 hypothetical protein [Actinomycetota bacterium]NIW33380.1 hypothetical protein [Actinomycetota bacterium]